MMVKVRDEILEASSVELRVLRSGTVLFMITDENKKATYPLNGGKNGTWLITIENSKHDNTKINKDSF